MQPCPSCGEPNGDLARFCSQCATPLNAAASHRERKVVTALFCDLVNSTALGERLDPETLQLVLDRYFSAVREVVEHHGGQLEKFIGDAAVAVFGVPVAHEDDALRAARAALDLQPAMAEVNASLVDLGVVIEIRVGIQSGDVVLDPASPHLGMIGGDAFNTAARLQSAATPGGILVGAATAELLAGWADLEPLAPMELRGKSGPERVFVLTGVEQRFRAKRATPFVGRSRQLAALHGAFRECVEDHASVLVTLLGVPGIGKSRVADQLRAELAGEATVLVGYTPTYGEAIAYAPVLGLLRDATSAVDPEAVVAGLRAIVENRPDAVAVADGLMSLVGGADPTICGDTAWALRRLLETMAAERPVVVVVEDIHFGGDPLLELLDRVATSVRGPIMVLCTARPELLDQRPTWGGGKPRAISISLGPLPAQDASELAMNLLADRDDAARRRLTDAAEGNPLYLEQLAAMVTESGTTGDVLEMPPSLRALLAARLDRLDPVESRVVDLAAVEGRVFRPEVITLLDPALDRRTVLDALERLEHRSLVTPVDAGVWRFAHALIQDAASRRTAKEDRAVLHVRLATHLAQDDAPSDEVIGAHLERAARLRRDLGKADQETLELERRAGERFATAGSRAYAHLGLAATAELLSRSAALLPTSDHTRVALMPDLGTSLMEIGRLDEAERLLRSAGQNHRGVTEVQRARIDLQLLALKGVYRAAPTDDVERYLNEASRIVARLEHLGDQTGLAQGWTVLEYLYWVLGRVSGAVDSCVKGVRAAQAAGRLREQWQAGGGLGLYLSCGFLPADQVEKTLGGFAAEPRPIWRLAALASTATSLAFRGDLAGFDRAQRQWAEFADVNGLEWPGAHQFVAMAVARIEVGDAPGAERALRASMDTMDRLGDIWAYAEASWMLPRAIALQGRHDETLALIERSEERDRRVVFGVHARIHEQFVTALGLQIRGRLAEAEAASRTGVDMAEGTEFAIVHTTALEQLAEIVEQAGRPDEARELRQQSLAVHDRQGNLVGAARVQALLT